MAKKKIVPLSLTPQFPKEAFLVLLFVYHNGEPVGLTPMPSIYLTLDEAASAVQATFEQTIDLENVELPEDCVLLPLHLHSLFPMEQHFWQEPTISYTEWDRMKAFMPLVDFPSFYSLLVTTSYIDESDTSIFHATLPLLHPEDQSVITRFMTKTDQVVDQRAKYSAIYQLGEKMQFNWKTKEVTLISAEEPEEIENLIN